MRFSRSFSFSSRFSTTHGLGAVSYPMALKPFPPTPEVSMDFMANGLLALGAQPAMVHSVEELHEERRELFERQGFVDFSFLFLEKRGI